MKLRMKLIISYTILAIVGAMILSIVYHYYNDQRYEENVNKNLQFLSNQLMSQFDTSEKVMEQTAEIILSDQEALSALRSLSKEMEYSKDVVRVQADKAKVRRIINTAYNMDNFYRVLVFNQYGFIASSSNNKNKLVNSSLDVLQIPWLDQVKDTKGDYILIGNHNDDWTKQEALVPVFSLIKEIQGDHLGFIEVQRDIKSLEEILQLPDNSMKILVITKEGEPIISSKGINVKDYEPYFQSLDGVLHHRNNESGKKELISISRSEYTGIRILLVQDKDQAMIDMPNSIGMALGIAGIFLVFSLSFIFFTANILTAPLRDLRSKMERTQIHNMDEKIEIKSSDGDVQALAKAYQDLLQSLSSSIENEKKRALLQLQAQFDTLQAQIHPHFIYNVLHVISQRGMLVDDETICEMCGHLASMLRYATNTKERYASIEQEVEYLKDYVYLLKSRYQNMLEVTIDLEDSIKKEIVPKIILQQFVENSIEHAFGTAGIPMKIEVKGYAYKNGWYIEIRDNGEGITQEKMIGLQNKMKEIRAKLKDWNEMIELEIGGMGLINTYGRMYLIYHDETIFQIKKREGNSGTIATIGVKGNVAEGGEIGVYSDGC